jgi:putative transcriptional regulator
MKKEKFELSKSIIQGLNEAIDYEKTKESQFGKSVMVQFKPIPDYSAKDVKNIRNQLNLTQKAFAFLFGVSPKTVEAWETGTNKPNGTARRMLSLLKEEGSLIKKFELMHIG